MTDRNDSEGSKITGKAVRDRMAFLAMSQAELARQSGVSVFTIRRLESGEPWKYRPANLRKVSRALGWNSDTVEYLLQGGQDAAADIPGLVTIETEYQPATLGDLEDVGAEVEAVVQDVRGLKEQLFGNELLELLGDAPGGILHRIEERLSTIERRLTDLEAGGRARGTVLRPVHDVDLATALAADADRPVTDSGVVAKSRRRNRPSPAPEQ